MKKPDLLTLALGFLGVAMLMCLGGIIGLSWTAEGRPIPDVLIGTTGTIVGAFATLLVGTVAGVRADREAERRPTYGDVYVGEHRADEAGYTTLHLIGAVVVVVLVVWVLLHLLTRA